MTTVINTRRAIRYGVSALAFGLFAAGGSSASAQVAAGSTAELDEVVVTGTRTTGRTVRTSVAPIDVVSGEAIEAANKPNLLEQLNSVLPSYFVPNVPTPNVGSMVRAGQLRGQNPGHTLVLVNGKRRHSTAFLGAGGFSATAPVDLSLIASGSISRIEVLRDGASAIYGSDAIAGVINIITDDSDSGGSASYRYGQFFEGDGQTNVVQLSQGFALPNGGHLRLSAQRDEQEIVIRNSPVNPALLFYFPISTITGQEVTPAGPLSSFPQLPANAIPNPREATRDNNAWKNTGKAPFTLTAFAADISLPLSDTVESYGYFTYADRESAAPQNFRTPNRDEVVRAIYPDGFTPVEEIKETDYSALGGIRGDNLLGSGWGWDLSTVYGRDDIDVYVTNSINATYGLDSQTEFYIGNHTYSAWTTNFDLRRSIKLASIPTDVSVGAEYTREHFELSAGDVQGYTHGGQVVLDGPRAGTVLGRSLGVSQALPAYSPADEQDVERNNLSLYAGLALKPTEHWTLDVAARAEDFSDFGRQETYRLSTRYAFAPTFAVRGTISTGFHAPALASLSYKATGNANTSTNHTLSVNSPEAIALGAQPLKPETSVNYSFGVVAEPFWGITFAIDAYRIDVEDRITQSTQFNDVTYPGSGALVEAAGFARSDGISYLINSSDTRTEGVELTVEKTFRLFDDSTLRLNYGANWNEIDVTGIAPTPSVLAAFNIPVFSQGAITNLKASVPKSRHIVSAAWRKGPLSVDLRQSYYGELERSGTPNPIATTGPWAGQSTIFYDIGALWITDLSVSLDVTDKVAITLSGNNIFDTKPDQTPAPLVGAQNLYAYANNGAIGPEGGFWSATLRYRF